MQDSTVAFDASWLSQFWTPAFIQADQAFVNNEFKSFVQDHGISIRPVPPRCHHKNTLESKHVMIRSIFLKLKHAQPDADPRQLAYQSLTVSNGLYGNYTVSSFEITKGFRKPIDSSTPPVILPQDLIDAHEALLNKRHLHMIL